MAGEEAVYVKLGARDIEIGKPLFWSVYDGNRQLLLKRGHVIETEHQREILVTNGLYRILNGREEGVGGARRPADQPRPGPAEGSGGREIQMSFDEIRIKIGEPVQLQSAPDAPRYYVRLVGYLKNRGLIVSVPEVAGELVMLREGQSFIGRMFPGQHAYAFTTNVVKQTSVPYPHLHLSYPREVRALEVRKGSRIQTDLIAAITRPGETEQELAASGKIVNLSLGGAALKCKYRFGNKDETINVKFKVPVEGTDYFISLDSVIRNASMEQSDPLMPYLYGIQFLNVDNSMSLALAAYLYKQLVDEARP